jgi:hypothetical protein
MEIEAGAACLSTHQTITLVFGLTDLICFAAASHASSSHRNTESLVAGSLAEEPCHFSILDHGIEFTTCEEPYVHTMCKCEGKRVELHGRAHTTALGEAEKDSWVEKIIP